MGCGRPMGSGGPVRSDGLAAGWAPALMVPGNSQEGALVWRLRAPPAGVHGRRLGLFVILFRGRAPGAAIAAGLAPPALAPGLHVLRQGLGAGVASGVCCAYAYGCSRHPADPTPKTHPSPGSVWNARRGRVRLDFEQAGIVGQQPRRGRGGSELDHIRFPPSTFAKRAVGFGHSTALSHQRYSLGTCSRLGAVLL